MEREGKGGVTLLTVESRGPFCLRLQLGTVELYVFNTLGKTIGHNLFPPNSTNPDA